MRAISYGGGVQSTALVVLAATGRLDADVALFANVGDDSEHPATVSYVRDIAQPWAAERGLDVLELHRRTRDGAIETLWGRMMKEGARSLPIPIRGSETGAPGSRACTLDFKIRVLAKWLREHGATEAEPADVLIGFSTDEFHRSNARRAHDYEQPVYPLLELGLSRSDCQQVIRDAGLPVPPKSACFFCPFHRAQTWAELRRDEPVLFRRSVELERAVNERRAGQLCPTSGASSAVRVVDEYGDDEDDPERWGEVVSHDEPLTPGEPFPCPSCRRMLTVDADGTVPEHERGAMYLTRFGMPLEDAIAEAQPALFGGDGPEECDDGYCWT